MDGISESLMTWKKVFSASLSEPTGHHRKNHQSSCSRKRRNKRGAEPVLTVPKRDTSIGSVRSSGRKCDSLGKSTSESKYIKKELLKINNKCLQNLTSSVNFVKPTPKKKLCSVNQTKTLVNREDIRVRGEDIDDHQWHVLDETVNDVSVPSSSMQERLPELRGDSGLASTSPQFQSINRFPSAALSRSATPPSSSILDTAPPHNASRDKWQQQVNTWEAIKAKFQLQDTRYREFEFLKYLNISDPFIQNYVYYQLGKCEPLIKGRVKLHYHEWEKLNPPSWLLATIKDGVQIPFIEEPPIFMLPNNKSATCPDNVQ